LYNLAEENGIIIDFRNFVYPIEGIYICDSSLKSPVIGLHTDLLTNERRLKCVLAEELGHHFTTGGNLVPVRYFCWSDKIAVNKGENVALRWALDLLIPDDELIEFLQRDATIQEIADYFYVTEEFVQTKLVHVSKQRLTGNFVATVNQTEYDLT
jgi:Zn-dependent peptidase ImmA (M78 family)